MSIENRSKINQLLAAQPAGTVMQSSWLQAQGYSLGLQKRYRESKWLKSIGPGALVRNGDQVSYEGGIYALQHQSGKTIHPAGKTAMILHGNAHYIEFSQKNVKVFGGPAEKLPAWFTRHDWDIRIDYYKTSFLPVDMGLVDHEFKNFSLRISSIPRAILECLYLAPEEQDLMECYHFMEGMNNVRPAIVQDLLESCRSIKVKRLFLFMAEKADHAWVNQLKPEKIDLGTGKRSIIKKGILNTKYRITIPKELNDYDERNV